MLGKVELYYIYGKIKNIIQRIFALIDTFQISFIFEQKNGFKSGLHSFALVNEHLRTTLNVTQLFEYLKHFQC